MLKHFLRTADAVLCYINNCELMAFFLSPIPVASLLELSGDLRLSCSDYPGAVSLYRPAGINTVPIS